MEEMLLKIRQEWQKANLRKCEGMEAGTPVVHCIIIFILQWLVAAHHMSGMFVHLLYMCGDGNHRIIFLQRRSAPWRPHFFLFSDLVLVEYGVNLFANIAVSIIYSDRSLSSRILQYFLAFTYSRANMSCLR